jgi:hypothetical protein
VEFKGSVFGDYFFVMLKDSEASYTRATYRIDRILLDAQNDKGVFQAFHVLQVETGESGETLLKN